MALSLTSRPATWSAAKNPVVYKFFSSGGPFDNYRVEIELFNADDDSSLTNGVKFSFAPDSENDIYADVSEILRSHLKPEWIYETSIDNIDEDVSIMFYIKYQEIYDGSSESVISDSANPIHAVLGALQIPNPNGNNLTDYVPGDDTKQLLTLFTTPKVWRDWPASFSLICPDDIDVFFFLRPFDVNGNDLSFGSPTNLHISGMVARITVSAFWALIIPAEAKRLQLETYKYVGGNEILSNYDFSTGELSPWVSVTGEGDQEWVEPIAPNYRARCLMSEGDASSEPLRQDFTEQPAGKYNIVSNITVASDINVTITFKAYLGSTFVQTLLTFEAIGNSTEEYELLNIPVASAFDRIELVVTKATGTGTNANILVDDVSLKPFNQVQITKHLSMTIEEQCKNPVMLFWKNSLGGDSFWLFEHDQEVSYNLSDSKAKRMILSANNLTANEWETLNELNHLGTVYKQNIIQLTSTVDKSHTRDGTQVYMVEKDGTKTGVIVIQTNNVMFTRMERHQFQIEIELPERYE